MSADGIVVVVSDALADRVNEWLSQAMTRAKVRGIAETDAHTATLPPFRKHFGSGVSESLALDDLRTKLGEWAKLELCQGRELPVWESKIPEVPETARRLVRVSNLQHELRTRGVAFGVERQNLPAGAVERCLVDIDAVVTRHAMQMHGVTPPARP